MKIPEHLYIDSFETGSNYICNPPVTNTDIDTAYLVYSVEEAESELLEQGWKKCGKDGYDLKGWAAYRFKEFNAILFDNWKIYDQFEAATELAKKRNLLDKKDRIELFSNIVQKQPKQKLGKAIEGAKVQQAIMDEWNQTMLAQANQAQQTFFIWNNNGTVTTVVGNNNV